MKLEDLTDQELQDAIGIAGPRLRAAIEEELDARRECYWLIEDGYGEDGELCVRECGNKDLSEHDGLCPAHTRGESLEDYLAPFGAAWQEEQEEQ